MNDFYDCLQQLKNIGDEFSPDFESYCNQEDPNAPIWRFSARFGERNEMASELEAQVHSWSFEEAKNIIANEGGFSIKLIEQPSQDQFDQCKKNVSQLYGDEVANTLY